MSRSDELVRLHLQRLRRDDARAETIRQRAENLRRAREALPCEIVDVDAETLWEWQDKLRARGLAVASIRCYSSHVRAFFTWAVREGHLERNPALDLRPPKVPAGRANPISEDRLRVAMSCAPDTAVRPIRTWLALAAYCGLRAGEVSRLRAEDVHDETLDVDGKGGRPRVVPLPAPVRALVLAHVEGPGSIWRHRSGRILTPDDVSRDCARHLRDTGAECSLHKLRHRFATRTYALSKDPMLVKELLGHASLATTQVYLGVSADKGRKVTDRLAEGLKRGNPRKPATRRASGDELSDAA